MTLLLLSLTGFVATYIVALKVRTGYALRQYEANIPAWVNQGSTYDWDAAAADELEGWES